jgi:hypothetical protein
MDEEGKIRLHMYKDAYCRTASKKYKIHGTDKFVHLTNDAVQRKCKSFGKYENSNKLTLPEMAEYFEKTKRGDGEKVFNTMIPR